MSGSIYESEQTNYASIPLNYCRETLQINDGMMPSAVGSITNPVDAMRFGLGLAEELDGEVDGGFDPHYRNSFASAELARAIFSHYGYASDDERKVASSIWEPALKAMDTLQELTRRGYKNETAWSLALNEKNNSAQAQFDFDEIFKKESVFAAIKLHNQAYMPDIQ